MINLPLLHSLDVKDYGLYPGDNPASPTMHIDFESGLTLVLGANGLGKTTLVTMLYRLLTGPNEIPALLRATDLGNARLEVVPLRMPVLRSFAHRVSDNAAQATARIEFDVGDERVSVERNLRDLSLRSFRVGQSVPTTDEQQYQDEMARLANVSSFGDWILLLRYIVFYFEDRLSLVWDPSAQRQLLRIFFLELERARHWTEKEREILEVDSEFRNLRSAVNRQERQMASTESVFPTRPDILRELDELEEHRRKAAESLEDLVSQLSQVESEHERARLDFLTLEQKRESLYREVERSQLLVISAQLPRHADTMRYIFAQLLSEAECLVCGNRDPRVLDSIESRIQSGECIVCGIGRTSERNETPVDLASERSIQLEERLRATDSELEAARNTLEELEAERSRTASDVQELQTAIARNAADRDSLLKRLPPEESVMRERHQDLTSLRAIVEVLQSDLNKKLLSFEDVTADAIATMSEQAQQVQTYFGEYAREFLFEDCRLVWSPRLEQLGQSGSRINFPAFGLELGGSDLSGTRRRSGPNDVSESQREFIDISFRMALAKVAARDGVTSLVMDAPESSLDVVFENRAARVLGTFGRPEAGNRLLITSNLGTGDLIPNLLRIAAEEGDRTRRVVDLLSIAAPTAAIRSLRDEYNNAINGLLADAEAPQQPLC